MFIISKDKNEDTKLICRELNRQYNNNNIITKRNLMLQCMCVCVYNDKKKENLSAAFS